jgi:hypothetical protein
VQIIGGTTVPAPLHSYVTEVATRVREVTGDRLVGVWLLGSAALQDYDPRRSDVDVQAVTTARLSRAEREQLVERLAHEALPNPARGLEFVLYAREDLAGADGPRFQLNLNTGPRMDHHVAYDADEDPGFWFVIDTSIARQHAVPLSCPPAAEVFPEPARDRVLACLLEAIDFFGALPGAADQTVLSACRAWAWASDGVWRSKGASARWAMPRLADPEPLARVLRRRDGEPADPLTPEEAGPVLATARRALVAR